MLAVCEVKLTVSCVDSISSILPLFITHTDRCECLCVCSILKQTNKTSINTCKGTEQLRLQETQFLYTTFTQQAPSI